MSRFGIAFLLVLANSRADPLNALSLERNEDSGETSVGYFFEVQFSKVIEFHTSCVLQMLLDMQKNAAVYTIVLSRVRKVPKSFSIFFANFKNLIIPRERCAFFEVVPTHPGCSALELVGTCFAIGSMLMFVEKFARTSLFSQESEKSRTCRISSPPGKLATTRVYLLAGCCFFFHALLMASATTLRVHLKVKIWETLISML